MKIFKRLFCKHQNLKFIENISGDRINYLHARSIWECKDCGKIVYSWELHQDEEKTIEEIKNKLKNNVPVDIVFPKTELISDGYHTFKSLYYQRLVLFATLCNTYKDKAWKSHYHEDGEPCFDGGWFIVGIDTPKGSYTYHYEDKYWDMFDCQVLRYGKRWDGHTDKDVDRLLSLNEVV